MLSKKSAGLSLIETVIALGLFSMVVSVYVMVMKSVSHNITVNRVHSESVTEVNELANILSLIMSHSFDMQLYQANSLASECCGGAFGGIREYSNSDHLSNHPDYLPLLGASTHPHSIAISQRTEVLALFKAETALSAANPSGPPAVQSQVRAGGLFYQRALPKAFGVLYLDLADQPADLSPATATFRWDHIVDFEISNVVISSDTNPASPLHMSQLPGGRPMVVGANFRVVKRFYRGQGGADQASWCPPSLMNELGCQTSMLYQDIEREIFILFKNSPRNISLTTYRIARAFENTFFFRPVAW